MSSAVRQIETSRVENSSIVNGSHEMVSPSKKAIRVRERRFRVIWSQRLLVQITCCGWVEEIVLVVEPEWRGGKSSC